MSNQSYDEKVKDILDRVAKGHLSTEEGATLIAAIKPSETAVAGDASAGTAAGATAGEPVADEGSSASEGKPPRPWPTGDEAQTPDAWADAVDSPASTPTTGPASEQANGTADPANGTADGVAAGPASGSTTGSAGAVSGVQDSAPEDVEEEHSNVPIPSGVQRVTVRAIGRRVRLIGEPAVNGVAVDGPHVIKRDGDTLAISSEGDMGVSIDGFSMLRNPTDLKAHVNGLAKELSIRVNPHLQVEVEVTGGSVNAERLPGLTRVRVTAGTAKVADVDGPIDVLVQAGSATLDAQITKGRSRVRVESGTANVALRRGSDVHVHTEAQLGRVTWSGAVSGQSKDVEIGRGRAALDVEVLVGTAQITSD
ncbi:hypothetical protein JOF29_001305 [Kribbella aluminosa]|uniref:Adhesin domain-containing protein n=1 Tax=Kribbella aluminosa TaxID=416017 RepID=A0ABS4UEZ8_9ACTN|nr:hypothetical protein [Kribbella aluminosa]MBP2350222.1 hypothetical protein [Kribbella aluminosa]